jgi:hypothetical protein
MYYLYKMKLEKLVKSLPIPNVLKQIFERLITNKYVLYAVLLASVMNVVGLIQLQNWNVLGLVVVVGLLLGWFTKNMTLILGITLALSTCVVCVNYIFKFVGLEGFQIGSCREGFKEGSDKTIEEEEDIDDISEGFKEGAKSKPKNKKQNNSSKNARYAMQYNKTKKKYMCSDFTKPTKARCKKAIKGKKKAGCYASDDTTCSKGTVSGVDKKSGFSQRSTPASVEYAHDEDDEVETNRVDYASTLEKAYTHLDKMLGSDGMKGLTNETKKLVQQQKGLMSSLEGMAPVLQKAQKTLNGLGPLPDMENMMSMMKKFGGNGK